MRQRFRRTEPSLPGRGLDHCVVTAASAISVKCELNIGKIPPYETYHAASTSRPRRRPCSRQTNINGATEAGSADNETQSCDCKTAGGRNMLKIILDGDAIRRPFHMEMAASVPIVFSNTSRANAVFLNWYDCLWVSAFSACSLALYGVSWLRCGEVEIAVDRLGPHATQ